MPHSQHGATVGTRVAMLVSRAMIATHHGLIGIKHKLAMSVFHAISNEISAEVDTVLRPVLDDLSASYPENGYARALLDFMRTEQGQLKALLGQGLAQQGLLWPLSQILNNELAPAVYDALRHSAQSLPDAGTIAAVAAQGTEPYSNALNDIAAWGFNAGWGNSLIALAQSWPATTEILTLRNRGIIDDNEARIYLKRAQLPDQAIDPMLATRFQPLPPADAALAVLRSDITEAEGEQLAALSGVDRDTFRLLIGNTGEPPGTMQLLEAYRRGIIDRDTLVRGILQSRVRNEWIPTIEQLRYAPMSVADAVNGFVQNHLDQATMRKIAEDNGLLPGQVDILALTAGEPLSRTEAMELLNRGEMTQAEVEQDLRESRLKDKYIARALLLRRRLIEPRMLSEAVQVGATTHDYAVQIALSYGYSPKDAEILVNHGSLMKLKTYRDRIVAGAEQLLEDGAITAEQAHGIITGLHYEDTEANLIVEAANFRRDARLVASAISAIRSKYIGRHIGIQKASGYLDALGVPATQRDQYLTEWAIEEAANVKQLTEAQVTKALKLQLITIQEAQDRLVRMGYNVDDAKLLIGGA